MAQLALHSKKLWKTIAALSKQSSRRTAAIAYVTADSPVRFSEDDVLITDASREAIAARKTSASVLIDAFRRGARIVSIKHLHAKVMLFDDTAVVGSCNLSSYSQTTLVEAAIVTDLPIAVAPVRAFLDGLSRRTPLEERDIERLLEVPLDPITRTENEGQRPRVKETSDSRLWILGVPDKDDEQISSPCRKTNDLILRDAKRSVGTDEIYTAWSSVGRFAKYAKDGDRVVVLSRKQDGSLPYAACPPSTIVASRKRGKFRHIGYGAESWVDSRSLGWSKFQVIAKRAGLHVSSGSCREVPDDTAALLEQIWPR